MIFHQFRQTVWACLLLTGGICTAAPGDLDLSFNGVGFTVDSIAGSNVFAESECVAIHSSGEIVTSGRYYPPGALVLWRHLDDGTLDETFGDGGVALPLFPADVWTADSCAIDQVDRIVVIATTGPNYVVSRFSFDGSPDLSFAGTGSVGIPTGAPWFVTGMAIDAENGIVGVGSFRLGSYSPWVVYHVLENGELDPSFGDNGIVFTEWGGLARATGVAIQPDGKIVVVGGGGTARYLTDGTLDPEFGSKGRVPLSGSKVVIRPDGKIAVAANACFGDYCNPGVAQLDDSGALDPSFGNNGVTYVDVGRFGEVHTTDLALQQDGAIVVAAYRYIGPSNAHALLTRFQEDGSLDDAFGLNGFLETTYGHTYNTADHVRLQSDGRIVVGGFTGYSYYDQGAAVTARYLAK